MSDVHSKEIRSYNMSQIKNKDTKPEMLVRKFLFSKGFRYRLHDKKMPGKPDLIFPKLKTVIFIHGCYWHGHEECRYFVPPKTRNEWWMNKINANKERDKRNIVQLNENQWNTIVIWECELKPDKRIHTLEQLVNKLKINE